MANSIEIITTADGSHSLLNADLNETYHSVHGARRESLHVFIKQGLEFFRNEKYPATIKIFEVGFGTGLNALLTACYAEANQQRIYYASIETFPLPTEIWSRLNYPTTEFENQIFEKIHAAPWNDETNIDVLFILNKIKLSLQQVSLSDAFDIIFFDAFAPNKQPELWELPILEKVVKLLRIGGVFVTYCAKGQLKRDLRSLGLDVQTLPGPPGKKEMVRALKI